MSLRDLSGWLIKNEGFLRKYQVLVANSIKDQFPELKSNVIPKISSEDIGYFLTCASSLAFSSDEKCQDAALRIAQYCLLNEKSEARKDSAALILDSLSNNPAIQLAENRGYLNPDFEERLPLKAQLELTKRKILYTIEIDADKNIYANRFQSEFWDAVQENTWVSVSAPTSVGKSFILESWVEQFVKSNQNCLVIYIVPTRALISEVYSELQKRLDPNLTNIVNIQTLPLSNVYQREKSNVFIFTQERLNLFYNHFSQIPKIDVLVVDEAHKIGDGGRGVILQHVIELTCLNNPDSKVIFASPFTLNPEILLSDAPILKNKRTIKSDYVTVNQNLIWVEQKPRKTKDWLMYYFANGEKRELGHFSLENAPSPESKRLPFVALCLGKGTSGNVVYVNGAAEAESTSKLISTSIENETEDEEILALIELSETIIHKNFALNRTLKKRVAFHYGNMPLIIKSEIERLFSKGKIDFLICTSTLVEGVKWLVKIFL
ncbi:DEAD/DEAH box helicase [Kosakonia cowanii]|uniref:DEAD/DEAH box helicase n=1 Tax=Kosakonia cowanii TaxID=208223 RepID=UPI0037C73447